VWGRGEYGRLGLGDKGGSSRLRPCKVKAIESHRVVQVYQTSWLQSWSFPMVSAWIFRMIRPDHTSMGTC